MPCVLVLVEKFLKFCSKLLKDAIDTLEYQYCERRRRRKWRGKKKTSMADSCGICGGRSLNIY